jgi:hypothetical protein
MWMAHIERNVFFVGITVREIAASIQTAIVAIFKRLAFAQYVGTLDAFDFYDLGTALSEHTCGYWAGAHPREITHNNAF